MRNMANRPCPRPHDPVAVEAGLEILSIKIRWSLSKGALSVLWEYITKNFFQIPQMRSGALLSRGLRW